MDAANPITAPGEAMPGFGRFWPGSLAGVSGAFERFDGYLLLPVRYLPTRAAIARGLAAGGPACGDLLAAWEAAWRACVGDPEAYAAEIGHDEAWKRAAERDRLRRARVEELADGFRRREAAEALCTLFRDLPGEAEAREPGLHVLEDAQALVLLAEARVPLRLVVPCLGRDEAPVLAVGPGDGEDFRMRALAGPEAGEVLRRWSVIFGATNPNWRSPALVRRAGRGIALCRGFPHVVATLSDMAAQGHGRAFLKHVEHKRGTWVADICGASAPDEAARRLVAALGLSVSDLASGTSPRDAVLVQGFLPFREEHRFFVVGHRVVASTPSERGLGIHDGGGRLLGAGLARLRRPPGAPGSYDRGEADVVHDRLLLARMARAARRLVRALRDEGVFPPHYVLDMGATPDGVWPVEVNTFANAGRYAVDYPRVARALGRWYAHPPPGAELERGYVMRIAPSLPARVSAAVRAFMQPPREVRIGGDDMGETHDLLRFLVTQVDNAKGRR